MLRLMISCFSSFAGRDLSFIRVAPSCLSDLHLAKTLSTGKGLGTNLE
jgi:hypothetical protein